jgi:hypothetical protein
MASGENPISPSTVARQSSMDSYVGRIQNAVIELSCIYRFVAHGIVVVKATSDKDVLLHAVSEEDGLSKRER